MLETVTINYVRKCNNNDKKLPQCIKLETTAKQTPPQ